MLTEAADEQLQTFSDLPVGSIFRFTEASPHIAKQIYRKVTSDEYEPFASSLTKRRLCNDLSAQVAVAEGFTLAEIKQRCLATTMSGGYKPRTLRCQNDSGHDGQCLYRHRGGQGGTLTRWWGANPRPVGFLDLDYAALVREVGRLRDLCEERGIDWTQGLEADTNGLSRP